MLIGTVLRLSRAEIFVLAIFAKYRRTPVRPCPREEDAIISISKISSVSRARSSRRAVLVFVVVGRVIAMNSARDSSRDCCEKRAIAPIPGDTFILGEISGRARYK